MNRNICNRCGSRISGDMTYCSMCGEQIPEEDISFVQPMPNYAGRDYGSYAYNNYYAAQAAMYMNYQQLVMNEYRKARLDNKGRVALLMIFLGIVVSVLVTAGNDSLGNRLHTQHCIFCKFLHKITSCFELCSGFL